MVQVKDHKKLHQDNKISVECMTIMMTFLEMIRFSVEVVTNLNKGFGGSLFKNFGGGGFGNMSSMS
jgi:hypothetical protein